MNKRNIWILTLGLMVSMSALAEDTSLPKAGEMKRSQLSPGATRCGEYLAKNLPGDSAPAPVKPVGTAESAIR